MNQLVANRIKRFRKRAGYSQAEACELIGLSQSAYSRLEKGETSSWTGFMDRICKHFDCSVNDLLSPDDLHVENPHEPILEGDTRKVRHDHPIQEKLLNTIEDLRAEVRELKERLAEIEGKH